jgi:hypothetical protein
MVVDSAKLAEFVVRDTLNTRGLRLTMITPGEQVVVTNVQLELSVRPSFNLDSVFVLPRLGVQDLTFIYDPPPSAPQGLRVGGVPTSRTVITLALPPTVEGTSAACALTTCPLALTGDRLNYAGLILSSRETEPGFRPVGSVNVQAVAVLAPEVLPKSPLGAPMFLDGDGFTIGSVIPPSAFAPGGARPVEVGITPLVEDLLRGETREGGRASPTIALLSFSCSEISGLCVEPDAVGFASFAGVDQPGEPMLRLILTISDPVGRP